MVSVKYKNIGIAYDDFIAVRNIDLEIPDGEITTLLGPSGCGKTTLLRSLAGFVEPFEGQIFLGDKDVTLLPPQKRNTAMIFQNYALWPHMSIFGNVEYGLKLRLKEKIVFFIKIKKETISDLSFSSYGATKQLEKIAEYIVDYCKDKNTETCWNLTTEEVQQELNDPKIKLKNIKYVLKTLKKAIRDHYSYVVRELPDWLPETKTKEEKVKYRKPIYIMLYPLTRPFFIFHPLTYKYVSETIEKEKKEYLKKHTSSVAKITWFLIKLWKYVRLPFSESKKAYLDSKEKIDPDWAFRRKKVFDALKMVHLEDQAYKNPPELSGGQQQRIALARAIVVEPDVLLCDEPLSNLDAKLRKELRTEIRSIIKKIGMTAVYVTHDQTEALAISDRIAVMNVGYIEQYGKPREVWDDPKTLFVAQFIGESTTLMGNYEGDGIVKLKGGEKIKIEVKEEIDKGTELAIVVRPEDVSLKNIDGCFELEIEIHTIEYLGKEAKLTGLLKDGTILLIDVVEGLDKIISKIVGDTIKVYINPNKLFVFKDNKRVY
ncbi:MAG: ABC transporter ATP-binding protein [Candidatus Heimdallarchaeaceae archaeon]